MTSQIKTVVLLALLSGLLIVIGGALGGRTGLILALGLALVMNVGSYWFSDKLVLKMYRAREVERHDAPALHTVVEELAQAANIPKPRVCIIPGDAPNAFATGRNPENGVVAVTEGILRILSPDELKGVLAHEISHIKHRDILIQTVSGVLASAVMFLASMARFSLFFGGGDDDEGGNPIAVLLLSLLAPIAAVLVQSAVSRSREYLADRGGAALSQNPMSLAGALQKLENYGKQIPMKHGNQATAHMFIVHPFGGGGLAGLFSTHPPTQERIRRLRAMTR